MKTPWFHCGIEFDYAYVQVSLPFYRWMPVDFDRAIGRCRLAISARRWHTWTVFQIPKYRFEIVWNSVGPNLRPYVPTETPWKGRLRVLLEAQAHRNALRKQQERMNEWHHMSIEEIRRARPYQHR